MGLWLCRERVAQYQHKSSVVGCQCEHVSCALLHSVLQELGGWQPLENTRAVTEN